MTELDALHETPNELADLTSVDALVDGLARIDAARGRAAAIERDLERERQNATALKPIWLRLITLLESAPPLPQSDTDALKLSKAIAKDLRSSTCPIGKPGSLSTEA